MSERIIKMVLVGMDVGETVYLNGQVVTRVDDSLYEIVSYGHGRFDLKTTQVMLAD